MVFKFGKYLGQIDHIYTDGDGYVVAIWRRRGDRFPHYTTDSNLGYVDFVCPD